MDKNSVAGLFLIAFILVVYALYTQPSADELKQRQQTQDSIAAVNSRVDSMSLKKNALLTTPVINQPAVAEADSVSADSLKQLQLTGKLGVFAAAAEGKKEFLTIENEYLKATISSRGGKINSVELKKYKRSDGTPLILFSGDSVVFQTQFPTIENKVIQTDSLYFIPSGKSFSVKEGETKTISFRLYAGSGKYIEHLYTLSGNSYMVNFSLKTVGMNEIIAANTNYLNVDWHVPVLKQEHTMKAEHTNTTIYYKYVDDEVSSLAPTEDAKESINDGKTEWVAFKQQFFTSAFISEDGFDKPTLVESTTPADSSEVVKLLSAGFTLPFSHKPEENHNMRFYFGPNHYNTLKQYNLELEKLIPLGWGIFGWVNRGIVIPLFHFLNGFNMNFGIVILLLTIIIKIVLLPLTYRAYLSQAKMKVLKPEIDEVNAKKKGDDPMKLQQEMMTLYRKAGVNPLGGCIPMVLQLPILIALFSFFPASIELRQESFLWATDLSTYDSIWDFGYVPLINSVYGDHVSLFTILMSASTIIYSLMNSQMTSSPQMAQMKWMMYLMPVVFLGVFNNYSAGLSYYYFLANIISIGQQYLFRSFVDEDAIHKKMQEYRKKPDSQKKSKFQQKLEDMAKQRGYKLPK